jgi:hypothetical protein
MEGMLIREFQKEEPANTDLYGGGGHEYTARQLARHIEYNDAINTIGIDGELGSGKSTVIKLTEAKLPSDKFAFVTFDADQHHLSLKSSMITTLAEHITSICDLPAKAEKIKDAQDRALGKKLTYSKETNSNFTWWTILFIVSLLLMTSTARSAVTLIASTLEAWISADIEYYFSWSSTVICLVFLSPIFMLLVLAISSKYKKEPVMPALANLIKRNSVDTINEILDVTHEVGSIELRNALTSIIECIPDDKCLVFVIDNMDRLAPEQVKELWGDLDSLTAHTSKKMKLLIPYSQRHISQALAGSSKETAFCGNEYITKKIPVSFQAPPIVTAGWRTQFLNYWEITLPDVMGQAEAADLIDIWQKRNNPVTPRKLKNLINAIGTMYDSCPENGIHGASCTAYILATKGDYPEIYVTDLLSSDFESNEAQKASRLDDEVASRLRRSHKLLDQAVGNVQEWSTQIASLHYKSTADVAKSELLVSPIQSAINGYDGRALLNLSKVLGFEIYFNRAIETTTYIRLVELLSEVAALEVDGTKSWVETWIPSVNLKGNGVDSIGDEDFEIVIRFDELLKSGYMLDLEPIVRTEETLLARLKSDSEDIDELLVSIHRFNKLTGNNSVCLENSPPELIVQHLWPEREKYDHWQIETRDINFAKKKSLLTYIGLNLDDLKLPHVASLLEHFMVSHRLGWYSLNDAGRSPLRQLECDFSSDETTWGTGLALLPYKHDWYLPKTWNQISPVANTLLNSDSITQDQKARFVAMTLVLAMGVYKTNYSVTVTYGGQSQPLEQLLQNLCEQHPEYQTYLANYLCFVPTFADIISGLKSPVIFPLIKSAVDELITEERVHTITVDAVFTDSYPYLRLVVENGSNLLAWLRGWESYLKVPVADWECDLIKDVLSGENQEWLERAYQEVNDEFASKEDWLNYLKSASPLTDNVFNVLDHMQRNDINVNSAIELQSALKLTTYNDDNVASYLKFPTITACLLNLISTEARRTMMNTVRANFKKSRLDTEGKLSLIRHFDQYLSLPKADETELRGDYIAMLDEAESEQELKWLGQQNWHLGYWSAPQLEELNAATIKHESELLESLQSKIESQLHSRNEVEEDVA